MSVVVIVKTGAKSCDRVKSLSTNTLAGRWSSERLHVEVREGGCSSLQGISGWTSCLPVEETEEAVSVLVTIVGGYHVQLGQAFPRGRKEDGRSRFNDIRGLGAEGSNQGGDLVFML